MDSELNIPSKMVKLLNDLDSRVSTLETLPQVTYSIRTTSGDPSTGVTGQHVVNTADRTLKAWADGAWRELASW